MTRYCSSEHEILETMHRYGGGFVKQLAVLYRLADHENQRRLEQAFRHYFEQYDAMAVHVREQKKKKVNR